jgi:hypothetical protein
MDERGELVRQGEMGFPSSVTTGVRGDALPNAYFSGQYELHWRNRRIDARTPCQRLPKQVGEVDDKVYASTEAVPPRLKPG